MIGIAHGCFDVLHVGHMLMFEWCKEYMNKIDHSNKLIVALASDIRIKEIKGPNRPIFNESTRARLTSAFRHINSVIITHDIVPNLHELRPNFYFKGEDTNFDAPLFLPEKQACEVINCEIVKAPIRYDVHSTEIVKCISLRS